MKTMALDERHVVVAVDDTENSKRAVLYVADILGGLPGFRATVLHIIAEPPPEYFKEDERQDWVRQQEARAGEMVERYRQVLLQAGFGEEKVETRVAVKKCDSLAECIFEEIRALDACTVAVGRRNISKKEEFLFGSTSDRIIHVARNCAVWVVE